jgi:AsmA protein
MLVGSTENAMGKRTWVWVGGVAAVVVVGLAAASMLVNADAYRGRIEAALGQALGRPVTLGHLDASLWSGSLVAEQASIADDPGFSSEPFVTAKEIKIGVEMLPLVLRRELHITGFAIEAPKIVLIRAEDGTWNYSSLGRSTQGQPAVEPGAPNPLPSLTVGKIEITDGTVEMGSKPAAGAAREYTDVAVSLQNFSFAGPFSFQLSAKLPGDGTVSVKGDAGPVAAGDASLTPVTADVELKHVDLAAAGLVDAGAGVGGVADLTAKVVSNGQTAQLAGKLELNKLRLAKNGTPAERPVNADFQVSEDLKALTGTVQRADVRIGKAALAASGTYATRGSAIVVQMKVAGPDMPVDDLEAFLPALGVVLPAGSRLQGGTLAVAMEANGPVSAPVVDGPVKVANTQLAGFDLGQKIAGVAALAGVKTGSATKVEVLSSTVHYAPDGIRTDAIDAVVTGLGSATGSGTISPGGELNYHAVVKLAGGVGAVASKAVGFLQGQASGGVPVRVSGTTANPVFAPDMGAMVGGVGKAGVGAGKAGVGVGMAVGKKLGGLLGR